MPNPAVFVFGQSGCPACEDYLPRFQGVAGDYRNACPIGVYDLAKDRRANEFATRLGIQATPTTVVMDRQGRLHRYVGAVGNAVIREMLRRAVG